MLVNIGCVPMDESHTGQAMADMTMALLQSWDLENKVYFMVTDSAAPMITMGDIVAWGHGDCANHTLQLCIGDEIFSMPSVESLIKKCREICTYANRSILFNKDLRDEQDVLGFEVPKQLVQDVVTRWNSTFDMMLSFIEL